jgi:hypothetical protein
MPLVRCLYASRIAQGSTAAMLDTILHQSRQRNLDLGITGLLCCTSDIFIQVLEGGRDEVCDLYNAIVKDSRHREVRLLCYEEIAERRFGNWSMGLVNVGAINPSLLLKYGKRAQLDPFAASGKATMALLDELLATGAISTRQG